MDFPPIESIQLSAVYADGPHVWVGPELWMQAPSRVRSTQSDYRVELVVDRIGDGVGVTKLEVSAVATGERIDSDAVRGISFRAAFTSATLNVINWSSNGVTYDRNPIVSVLYSLREFAEPSTTGRYQLPEGDALRGLAAVVRAARLLGAGPAMLLRDQLGLPATTARYWVDRIKTLGYLDDDRARHQ